MATQIIKKLLDDLDGGDADETMTFAFDGSSYTIDLSAKNAAAFRELMSKYQEAATRTGRAGLPPSLLTRSGPAAPKRNSASLMENRAANQKIRDWALANGYELADRGRISQHVADAYETKTPNPAWVASQALAAEQAKEQAAKPAARKRAPAKAAKDAKVTYSNAS